MDPGRVLVVTPDVDAGDLYSLWLAAAGVRGITWVPDVGAARRLLQRQCAFDAVIIDVVPPVLWADCRTLAQASPATPVIVITGWVAADKRYRITAFDAGCAAFLAKPSTQELVAEALHRVRQGERGIAYVNTPVSTSSST
jgi:DNA-binding response OmpR family regulator